MLQDILQVFHFSATDFDLFCLIDINQVPLYSFVSVRVQTPIYLILLYMLAHTVQ